MIKGKKNKKFLALFFNSSGQRVYVDHFRVDLLATPLESFLNISVFLWHIFADWSPRQRLVQWPALAVTCNLRSGRAVVSEHGRLDLWKNSVVCPHFLDFLGSTAGELRELGITSLSSLMRRKKDPAHLLTSRPLKSEVTERITSLRRGGRTGTRTGLKFRTNLFHMFYKNLTRWRVMTETHINSMKRHFHSDFLRFFLTFFPTLIIPSFELATNKNQVWNTDLYLQTLVSLFEEYSKRNGFLYHIEIILKLI